MITTVVALLAPLWLPMLTTFAYAFVIRRRLANPQTADKRYWAVYVGACLLAVASFIWQIWSWQVSIMARLLWLIGLGLPMLGVMAMVVYLSIMASDGWGIK